MLKRFDVVHQFVLRSIAFVVAMALLLGVVLTFAVRGVFLEQAARTAHVTANAIVLHHVKQVDLQTDAIPPATVRILDEMLAEDLSGAGITTIKLWNTQGTLIYSSDRQKVGESFADHPPFVAALGGAVQVEVADEPDEENEAQFRQHGREIEVYAPLVSGGRVLGVFEIYQEYAPVSDTVNRFIMLMWIVIVAGSVPAYFLQLTMMRRIADELHIARGALAEVNARLTESFEDMEMHSLGTMQALVGAVDAKDSYTARHSIAVTDYAVAIAKRMGLPSSDVVDVERAGLLHDVGKIGTPESILLKPDRLTDEEFSIICEHSEMSGHIVEAVPFLSRLVPILRGHHERWDGKGYPDGLSGTDIPLLARILMVADTFDAMTSERPYREAVSVEDARAELLKCSGAQFDPDVVEAMLAAIDGGDAKVVVHAEEGRARRR